MEVIVRVSYPTHWEQLIPPTHIRHPTFPPLSPLSYQEHIISHFNTRTHHTERKTENTTHINLCPPPTGQPILFNAHLHNWNNLYLEPTFTMGSEEMCTACSSTTFSRSEMDLFRLAFAMFCMASSCNIMRDNEWAWLNPVGGVSSVL